MLVLECWAKADVPKLRVGSCWSSGYTSEFLTPNGPPIHVDEDGDDDHDDNDGGGDDDHNEQDGQVGTQVCFSSPIQDNMLARPIKRFLFEFAKLNQNINKY